jgi:hypothetical protein
MEAAPCRDSRIRCFSREDPGLCAIAWVSPRDDREHGDAVPGGKDTSPGTQGNGPHNSDGFYLVSGLLFSDTEPIEFPGGGFVWPDDTTIKYTERGNPNIDISKMAGPNSVIEFHVQAPGDLYVDAPKGADGAIFCGVPPPPF